MEHLHQIINLAFESRTFPDLLKFSLILLVFKKDKKDSMENYTPTANFSDFLKTNLYVLKGLCIMISSDS